LRNRLLGRDRSQYRATEIKTEKLSCQIRATTASTQVYSELEDTSYTPPESAPAGLAEAIYAGVSQLHYDGRLTWSARVVAAADGDDGRRAQPAQQPGGMGDDGCSGATVSLDVDHGRTKVKIGWPHQLMPADLMQIYRANRFRRDVTSDGARATGVSGDSSGNTAQSLARRAPAGGGPAGHVPPTVFTAQVTLAAPPVLASTDLQSALRDSSNPDWA